MKLEVGMYVRTVKGIAKIKNIFSDGDEPYYGVKYETDTYLEIYYDSQYIGYDDIVKASYNIIDILEVGDYVNGSEVLGFEYKLIKGNDNFTNFAVVTENCYLENTDSWIIEKNIKSVITHEQMKQIEYKVGE